jgi:hypothetical protein
MQKRLTNTIALFLLILSSSYILWYLFTDMTKHNNFRKIDKWEEINKIESYYNLEDKSIDVFIGKDYGYLKNPYVYHSNADGVAYNYGNKYAIWIRDGLSNTRFITVVFHEFAHVYYYAHNMRSSNTESNVEYKAFIMMRENGYKWESFCLLHLHTWGLVNENYNASDKMWEYLL